MTNTSMEAIMLQKEEIKHFFLKLLIKIKQVWNRVGAKALYIELSYFKNNFLAARPITFINTFFMLN